MSTMQGEVPEDLIKAVMAANQQAALQHQHDMLHAQQQLEAEMRREMLRFSAITCICEPWPQPRIPDRHPAQMGCPVHSQISIFEGEVF